MISKQEQLRDRTKQFALTVINLCDSLPNRPAGWVIGKQLLRSASSVAANYRAAGRARSRAEFVAKIGLVVEEADETVFWLDLLGASRLVASEDLRPLWEEGNELLAILAASYNTAKANRSDAAR